MMQPESAPESAWLDQTLDAFVGAARAEPNPFLYARIRQGLVSRRLARVSGRQAWATAAALALLAVLNWRVVSPVVGERSPNPRAVAEQVVSDYDLGPTDDWSL